MSIDISKDILGLKGQRVNEIKQEDQQLIIHCCWDKRRRAVGPVTGKKGTIIAISAEGFETCHYLALLVSSTLSWHRFVSKNERRVESCEFVDKGCGVTHRFCHIISGLCRHMSIQAVARHLSLRWETVKNIDRSYLEKALPALDPTQLTGLKYIGVDEVASKTGKELMKGTHYLNCLKMQTN